MWNTLQWPRELLLNLSHDPTVVHGKSTWEETWSQDLGSFCTSCIGTPSVLCKMVQTWRPCYFTGLLWDLDGVAKGKPFLKSLASAPRRELRGWSPSQMVQSIMLQSSTLPCQMKGLEYTSANLWGFGEGKSDSLQIKENCDLEKWCISVSLCVWNLFF